MPKTGNKGLKLSFSKSLFCEKTTEIRTLQNDLIGTIKEIRKRSYIAQNAGNVMVEVCSYTDAKRFILDTYINTGKPSKKKSSWQLHLFN